MTLTTTTHLNFRGDAREALEFYQSAFGGTVLISTYADFGMPAGVPGADSVVFGLVTAENGFRIMGYDIPGTSGGSAAAAGSTRRESGATLTDQPFFVSVRGTTLGEVEGFWAALSTGATIVEPLTSSAWSAGFGMLTDRFGVTWILDVEPAESAA